MSTPPPTDPPVDPPPTEIDPAVQAQFNTLFKGAMAEFIAENAPAPPKTTAPVSILDALFGGK